MGASSQGRTRCLAAYEYGPPLFQTGDTVTITKDTTPGVHWRYSYDKYGRVTEVVNNEGRNAGSRNEHPRESSSSTAKEQKTTWDHTGTRNFISTNQRDLRKPTKARRGGEYGLCICIRLVSGSTLYNIYNFI